MKKNINIVKLLTATALTLPGFQPAFAESPPAMTRAEFGYGTYDESGARYDINVYESSITVPVTEKTSISLSTVRDLQTGASMVLPVPQTISYAGLFGGFPESPIGNPSVLEPIITQASITEVRDSFSINGSYYFPESIVSVGYRYSTEDDYLSHSVNAEWRKLFNKKNTELSFGVGYSDDQISPTEDKVPTHLPKTIENSGSKSVIKAVLGLRQDWDPKTTSDIGLSFSHDSGYLADPYKRVIIYGNALGVRPGSAYVPNQFYPGAAGLGIPAGLTADYDRRPGHRDMWSIMGKIIRYIETFDSAIHAEYVYTHNDWDIGSNMLEFSYHQPFGDTWRVVPLVRYYTQSEAYFYAYAFEVTGGAPFPAKLLPVGLESSSDNRLSKFGSLNTQISLSKKLPFDMELDFVGGIYMSREWLHLGSDPEVSNPWNNYTATYFGLNVAIDFA